MCRSLDMRTNVLWRQSLANFYRELSKECGHVVKEENEESASNGKKRDEKENAKQNNESTRNNRT